MLTEKVVADDNLATLKKRFRQHSTSKFPDRQFEFELAYNENEFILTQLAEVVRQKVGVDNFPLWVYLYGAVAAPDWFSDKLRELASQTRLEAFVNDDDLRRHLEGDDQEEGYIKALKSGKTVLAVAHSQGNLYANAAWDRIYQLQWDNGAAMADFPPFGLLSVASPASRAGKYLREPEDHSEITNHITLADDRVVNFVRLFYFLSGDHMVLPGNYSNSGYDDPDWLSHSFVQSYLNGPETSPAILESMENIISNLRHSPAIELSPQSSTIAINETRQFRLADVPVPGVVWTSSNTGVATVDANGLAAALRAGETEITANLNGKLYSGVLTVEGFELNPLNSTVSVNNTVQFRLGDDLPGVVWTSSNTDVVTIDSNGLAAAVNAGVAEITASLNNRLYTTNLTVVDPGNARDLRFVLEWNNVVDIPEDRDDCDECAYIGLSDSHGNDYCFWYGEFRERTECSLNIEGADTPVTVHYFVNCHGEETYVAPDGSMRYRDTEFCNTEFTLKIYKNGLLYRTITEQGEGDYMDFISGSIEYP